MQIMNEDDRRVIGGVDAHADTHHAAALDERGALLGSRSFTVSASGYRELLAWLGSFGEVERIEGSGVVEVGAQRVGHGWVLGEDLEVQPLGPPTPV